MIFQNSGGGGGGGEDYAYGRIVWGRLTKGDWY